MTEPASTRAEGRVPSRVEGAAARRSYLDVLRGVAVLVMIEAHVIDSWTRAADRRSRAFGESLILGGFGAPLFLFLAGVAVAMSAGSKARRLGDDAAAVRLVQQRGLQIFLLAFLFRLQAFVLSHGPTWSLLKVDILNIMGLAIIAAATLWGAVRTARARAIVFGLATAAIVWAAPIVRGFGWLAPLPDWIEGYLRPVPALTNFSIFPWAAFVTAGAVVGVILDAARTPDQDRRVNLLLGTGGVAIAFLAYKASFMPPLLGRSSFWTTSSSFFFIRLGLMLVALGVAYVWERRPSAGRRWSPMRVFGRSSLFIYWIHVEMVYGLVSTRLHHALPLQLAWVGLVVFCLFMLLCAVVKDRVVMRWRGRGGTAPSRPAQLSPAPNRLAPMR
jgi:uncharacterized membrane protein